MLPYPIAVSTDLIDQWICIIHQKKGCPDFFGTAFFLLLLCLDAGFDRLWENV